MPRFTRRGFIAGAGAGVASTALPAVAAAPDKRTLPAKASPLTLTINGKARTLQAEPRTTLAEALRNDLGLTGTKVVCDRGACSACTVHVDGTPMLACTLLAHELKNGQRITTVEGLANGDKLSPIQAAFVAQDAMQCGFCTPGMVMSCSALLQKDAKPDVDSIKGAICGNLCRCGTYPKVIAAVQQASGQNAPEQLTAAYPDQHAPKGDGPVLGLAGVELKRDINAPKTGEPPAWPANADLKLLGRSTPRIDGKAKVTGTALYTADIRLPGMLFARRVVSPHAHANVRSIDTSAAEKLPGVRAVHLVERLTEGAKLRNPESVPGAKYPRIRYAGQAVAAVAATSQAIADEAVKLIKVDYEPLPFAVELEDARKEGAPLVFEGPTEQPPSAGGGGAPKGLAQSGNVRGPDIKSRGDVEKGLKEAALKVSGEFSTHVQTHSALEPHGVVADWKDDGLTVFSSTQGTATVRDELAEVFGLPKARVRVVCEYMGGGFGAKFGAGTYGVLATHLSRKAKAPVRLILDRAEEHVSGGNRPATTQSVELGAKKDGALTALHVKSWGTGGVSTGSGPGFFAERLYETAAYKGEHSDVFTHTGPAAAFRAPGNPQGAFAIEQAIDELAEKLQVDPLKLRDKLDVATGPDAARDGSRAARKMERELGAERIGWAKRHAAGADKGTRKRGIGAAQSLWRRIVDMDSACELRIAKDGSVKVMSSVMDIGTGTRTALALIAAEELGLQPQDITLAIGDTLHPIGPASGGSKTLVGLASVVRNAAWQAKLQLFFEAAPAFGVTPAELEVSGGMVRVKANPSSAKSWKQVCAMIKREELISHAHRTDDYGGNPNPGYGGVQFAEVEVDTETGVVKVLRVVAVHECGRVLNPLAVQSQINGGVIHGLSYALFEQRKMDPTEGRMLNADLEHYKIAGAKDIPPIEVILLEQYGGLTSVDANGIGEPANVPTAAAIANAFYNATGMRIRELPMTPRAVLAALSSTKGGRS